MSAVPELKNGCIDIFDGPAIDFTKTKIAPAIAMQTLLSFFEGEIQRNPSIWSAFVKGSLRKYKEAEKQKAIKETVHPQIELASNSSI
jgi:hypothetical protein